MRIILEKIHQLSNHWEEQQAHLLMKFLEDIREGEVLAEGNTDRTLPEWMEDVKKLYLY